MGWAEKLFAESTSMSRIGKQPITLPDGVTATLSGAVLTVKGPRGALTQQIHADVIVLIDGQTITVNVADPERADNRALWGLFQRLIANMVTGVTAGFTKSLELVGVGYRVAVAGQTITLNVGFSHPVNIELPEGVTAKADKNTLTLEGSDKQVVGELAAQIRRIRKPEPYKGKGIKYVDEVIRRKAGKAAKAVGK